MENSIELAKQIPNDFPVQGSAWLTPNMLGEMSIDKQDGTNSVNTCLPGTDFPRKTYEREPENGVVAFDLAISYFNLARSYRLVEDYPNAIAQSEKALEVMTELAAKNPDDLEYQRNLAIYQTEIARARLKLDKPAEAAESARKIIDILVPITTADPGSMTVRYDLAMAYRIAATAHHQLDDDGKALEFINQAIDIVRDLEQKGIIDPTDEDLLAELEAEKTKYSR